MKILIEKVENGWIIKTKDPFSEEPNVPNVRVVHSEDMSDAAETIALLNELVYALGCTWGKREQENIKIFTLPGHDATMKDDKQLEKVLDIAEDVLDRLSEVSDFPKAKDEWSSTDEVVQAVKFYKDLVSKKFL